jgi:hypothetical protein
LHCIVFFYKQASTQNDNFSSSTYNWHESNRTFSFIMYSIDNIHRKNYANDYRNSVQRLNWNQHVSPTVVRHRKKKLLRVLLFRHAFIPRSRARSLFIIHTCWLYFLQLSSYLLSFPGCCCIFFVNLISVCCFFMENYSEHIVKYFVPFFSLFYYPTDIIISTRSIILWGITENYHFKRVKIEYKKINLNWNAFKI